MPNLVLHVPAERCLPSNELWENRFEVVSQSSGKAYIVGQNREKRGWGCSCQGWRTHRKCKHLRTLGLPMGEQAQEVTIVPVGSSSAVSIPSVPKAQTSTRKTKAVEPAPTPSTKPKRAISFTDDF